MKLDPHVATRWHCLCTIDSMISQVPQHEPQILKELDWSNTWHVISVIYLSVKTEISNESSNISSEFIFNCMFSFHHLWFDKIDPIFLQKALVELPLIKKKKACSLLFFSYIHPFQYDTQCCDFLSQSFPVLWKAASGFNPTPPRLNMKPRLGPGPLAALWMMGKISCQFLFGRVWTRTWTVSLFSSGVTSARQQTSWTGGEGGGGTVENNLVHSYSCHVGLVSSWTVIYFRLPQSFSPLQ